VVLLPIAALATLPWLAALPGALQRAARASPAESGFRSSGFLLVYCGVVLGFFSLSQSKLAPYILPMMPPLAALAGIHIGASGRPLRRAGWIAAALVTLSAAGLVVYCAAPVRCRSSVAAPVDIACADRRHDALH